MWQKDVPIVSSETRPNPVEIELNLACHRPARSLRLLSKQQRIPQQQQQQRPRTISMMHKRVPSEVLTAWKSAKAPRV